MAFLDAGPAQRRTDARHPARLPRVPQDGRSAGLHGGDAGAGRASAREHEGEFIANMAYLAWSESITWDRDLLQADGPAGHAPAGPVAVHVGPGERRASGSSGSPTDFDSSKWHDIGTTAGLGERRRPGSGGRPSTEQDYNGIAWYRTQLHRARRRSRGQVRLVFGAVDEACKVWLNGELILERPYPYQGNTDSWRQSFEMDITKLVRRDQPNVLAVRVEDNAGAGGVWKPVWLVTSEAPQPRTGTC